MSLVAEASVEVRAAPETVWSVLVDGDRWGEWNPRVRWMVLEGPPAPGSFLTMQPVRGRQTAYTIVEAASPSSLAFEIRFGPLGRIEHRYRILAEGGAVRINGRVETAGLLARFLARTVGKRALAALPETLAGLARAAEKSEGRG